MLVLREEVFNYVLYQEINPLHHRDAVIAFTVFYSTSVEIRSSLLDVLLSVTFSHVARLETLGTITTVDPETDKCHGGLRECNTVLYFTQTMV